MVIWKYRVVVADEFRLTMPEGAVILHVGIQGDLPWLWALVDRGAPLRDYRFRVLGTGHDVPAGTLAAMAYVATFQTPPFVWHLFRET